MATSKAPVGVLGGTFDPVHNGHLRLAMELVSELQLDHIRLIPNGRPPHRDTPGASCGQRAKWIRVAVANEPSLRLDDRELLRDGPSYMVDTLTSLRRDLPQQPLCLVMGRDVFAKLPEWRDWQRLFELAHIVLINRPDLPTTMQSQARDALETRTTSDKQALHDTPAGLIYSYAPPPLAISSSRIRNLLIAGQSPRYLLPDSVLGDIMETGIYQSQEPTQHLS